VIESQWIGPREGPTLVFLHEGLGSLGLWRDFPQRLSERTGLGAFVYSRAGYGKSTPAPLPRPVRYMHDEAALLPQILQEAGVNDSILVGHSDGGSIALIHAAKHPVAGLALIAPHVFVEDLTVQEIRRTRELFETGGLRERMARHHDDPDAAFRGWCDVWVDPAFPEWNIEADARRVTAPALLIQGADDPYGTLAQIDRIEAAVRGPVERVVVDGAGHSPHLEAPEPALDALTRFVARLP
jgi:pimeloyl-ACP methyl ester carboxylesterase